MKKKLKLSDDPFFHREKDKYETPIPSREFILEALGKAKGALCRKTLMTLFSIGPESKIAFKRRLRAMVRDGQIMASAEGYFPFGEKVDVIGRLRLLNGGAGLVALEGTSDKVFILPKFTRGFLEGDILKVRITGYRRNGAPKGEIIALVTPVPSVELIGELKLKDDQIFVSPFDQKYPTSLRVTQVPTLNVSNKMIAVLKMSRNAAFEVVTEIIEILEEQQAGALETQMAIRAFHLPYQWPESALKEVNKWPTQLTAKDKKNRVDLCELPLVTIDGQDAKDFDDAVYCEPRGKNGWRLYVAIADVSHYVRANSHLDKSAKERGNSTYFVQQVLPMLPERLSNELCSLKPHVDRLCMVCEMCIDATGKVTRSSFYEGVMHSFARLTYDEVNGVLNQDKGLKKKYAALVEPLSDLLRLYKVLFKARQKRGAIEFDTVETQFHFNPQGRVSKISPVTRNVAHRIIEECMLAANVCASRLLRRKKMPSLYRNHDKPNSEKLNALREFVHGCGLKFPGGKMPKPSDFNKMVSKIKGRPDEHALQMVMLRTMSQAFYSPKNQGHFGLAFESYLHFTSPIRRYPDLVVHRAIKAALALKKGQSPSPPKENLEALGLHCSTTERRSDEATRQVVMALKCQFMEDKIGQEFEGSITGVTHFGLFVELNAVFVEGLLHVTSLCNDYYWYDSIHHRLVGESTGEIFQLGDKISVRIRRVDLQEKKIDLALADDTKSKKSVPKKANKAKKAKRRQAKKIKGNYPTSE